MNDLQDKINKHVIAVIRLMEKNNLVMIGGSFAKESRVPYWKYKIELPVKQRMKLHKSKGKKK